jgi:hypothetical protein
VDAAGDRGRSDDEDLRHHAHADEGGLDALGVLHRTNDELVRESECDVEAGEGADAPRGVTGLREDAEDRELHEAAEPDRHPRGLPCLFVKELIAMITPHRIG